MWYLYIAIHFTCFFFFFFRKLNYVGSWHHCCVKLNITKFLCYHLMNSDGFLLCRKKKKIIKSHSVYVYIIIFRVIVINYRCFFFFFPRHFNIDHWTETWLVRRETSGSDASDISPGSGLITYHAPPPQPPPLPPPVRVV